ncbi:MAG: hypothetical protein ABSD08_15445 [Xanthobacteraceae bacterium]|jgi:hypothetical protein
MFVLVFICPAGVRTKPYLMPVPGRRPVFNARDIVLVSVSAQTKSNITASQIRVETAIVSKHHTRNESNRSSNHYQFK